MRPTDACALWRAARPVNKKRNRRDSHEDDISPFAEDLSRPDLAAAILSRARPSRCRGQDVTASASSRGPASTGASTIRPGRWPRSSTASAWSSRGPARTRARRRKPGSSTTATASTSGSTATTASPAASRPTPWPTTAGAAAAAPCTATGIAAPRCRATTSSASSSIRSRTSATPTSSSSIPAGARGEGLVYAGDSSLNWDGIWEAESVRLEDGWSAEFRIPFKTISFKPGLSVWGINIERTIARKQETIRLSGTTLDSNFNNPNEAAAARRGSRASSRAWASPSGPTAWPAPPRTTSCRTGYEGDGRRRLRPLQELHAQPRRRRQLQHGFRRDRGRRAPHQPDPLPDVLPGEADVLPRGLRELQLQLEHQLHAVLQPDGRALQRDPDPGPVRDQALRQDRRAPT